jgi:hypothetical protein
MPGSTKSALTDVVQAKRDFKFETDRQVFETSPLSTMENTPLDWIMIGPEGSIIGFWAFAEKIPAGTSVDDVISESVGDPDEPCESEPMLIDGQPGRFDVCGEGMSIAVVIVGDRAYVFVQGRGSVTKDLMLAQLSTVQLPTA